MSAKYKNQLFAVAALLACHSAASVEAAPRRLPNRQVQIVAEGMCCEGCARKVSGQLYAARGVKDVGVDMKSHTVTVTLPEPSHAMLGNLWQAVEQGDGAPAKLVTTEAIYTLKRPEPVAGTTPQTGGPLTIAIDNLHCSGCAKKIAGQLFTLKGVTQVGVDMQNETLTVETKRGAQISPWAAIDAVAKANERPLAVNGAHGQLSIQWATKAKPKNHPPQHDQTNHNDQARQPKSVGAQR